MVIVVVDQDERLRVSPEEVSNRHISDFLKHIELLNRIEVEYHTAAILERHGRHSTNHSTVMISGNQASEGSPTLVSRYWWYSN